MNKSAENEEIILHGVAASPGVAFGLAHIIFHKELEIPVYTVEPESQESEIARFEQALLATRSQISKVRQEVSEKLGEDEAKIFDAHLLVLEDKALIDETIHEHQQFGYNIEYCFHAVAKRYIEAFGHIDDEYIKERVTDIKDVTKRILHNLLGHTGSLVSQFHDSKVLVSEDLVPSDTAGLDRGKVLAMVTDVGSRTSHAVIMARSLQVPAVVGLHNISSQARNGDTLLVDGYEGIVIINPSKETLYRYKKFQIQKEKLNLFFQAIIDKEAKTLDGHKLSIAANIESPEDIESVKKNNLEGVGLFRTEALFLKDDRFPDEETQFHVYKEVASKISPKTVTIRTIDLGGDKKTSSFFYTNKENNPFMGFRAIRFCLEHKIIFKEQLRAILRASHYGKVAIMYPMISSVQELISANELLEIAKKELQEEKIPFDPDIKVGTMIEIPSAAYTADLIAKECDFFSIGTNDLIQYMLAVDRVNDRIAHLYEPYHPAIIRTLNHIIKEAHKANIPVSICGEMAADPIYLPLVFGLGANSISISATAAPEIKYLIRNMKLAQAQALAQKVLKKTNNQDIFTLLHSEYMQKIEMITPKDEA